MLSGLLSVLRHAVKQFAPNACQNLWTYPTLGGPGHLAPATRSEITPMNTPTIQTEVIDLADLDAVRASVEKANKKAAKIGVAGYTITLGERSSRDITAPDPFVPGAWKVIGTVGTVEVTVTGEAPKYAGWTFVATIDWVGNDAVIKKVNGLEDIDTTAVRATLVPNGCDHCNAARDRNETYLLRHEDGAFKQVGSTCLRDFLGVQVNLSLIGYNPYSDCDSTNRYAPEFFTTLGALEDTLALVRAYGWVSAGAAYNDPSKTSTKDRLIEAYKDHRTTVAGRRTAGQEYRDAIVANHREDDAATAEAVLAWVRSDAVGNSDYAQNLRAAVGTEPRTPVETFRFEHLGIVISAVTGYQRWVEKNAAKETERTQFAASEFVGAEKERLRNLRLTVRSSRWVDSQFGSSLLVLLHDEAGNAFKTFASNPSRALETAGAVVVLDGTVKKHETYNGLKSTVLTRCSVKEEVTA